MSESCPRVPVQTDEPAVLRVHPLATLLWVSDRAQKKEHTNHTFADGVYNYCSYNSSNKSTNATSEATNNKQPTSTYGDAHHKTTDLGSEGTRSSNGRTT